ncbi:nuclease-related domain-containing protein [Actinomadura sp. DC4]|uniref:nuclease-related domain-containing protein n=1 Tax=Actinomadura sp. DC4 TaxID=3055069 RepID=UPI0025B19AE7|nr:nuclease-related domain-containing protein [Actinomadura sp. DC4]MDN3353880.1 nuclease-related domain-containing protein [Actinomadura sp. DC4]
MAGASAQARYRRLRAEYRQERVLARLVLAGVAGSMTAGVFGWLRGMSVALGLLLAHSLFLRVRPDAVTRWRRGAAAERRTGRRLSRLDPAYFHVLHDRALPSASRANLDHLVVGLTGVYAIVSRRLPPLTRLRVADDRLWAGPRPIDRLPMMARSAARTVGERLSADLGRRIEVDVIVAVHGGRMPHLGITIAGVTLRRAKRARRLIQRRPAILTTAQVTAIAAAAERILPPMIDV